MDERFTEAEILVAMRDPVVMALGDVQTWCGRFDGPIASRLCWWANDLQWARAFQVLRWRAFVNRGYRGRSP